MICLRCAFTVALYAYFAAAIAAFVWALAHRLGYLAGFCL